MGVPTTKDVVMRVQIQSAKVHVPHPLKGIELQYMFKYTE